MNRTSIALAAWACILIVTPGTAPATIVTFQFSGAMNDAFGSHPIGTPFSGSITYDDSQADVGSPNVGNYVFQNLNVTVGGDTVNDNGPGSITVYDNLVTPYPTDLLIAASGSVSGAIGGLTLDPNAGLQLALQDISGNAFTGIGLPDTGLTLANLTQGNATFIQLTDINHQQTSRGELGSLVPEPSAALLSCWAAGLMALALGRCRKMRAPT